jgi:lycopene cyclase domain-containing protein
MTYAGFLLLFLVLPLGVMVAILRRRLFNRRYLAIVGVLTLVALIYMAPWDHIAAVWGLWTWTKNQTWGLSWWTIPLEEYLFCVLEALLAITLTYAVLTRKGAKGVVSVSRSRGRIRTGNVSVPTLDHAATTWDKDRKGLVAGESDQEARS